MDKQEAIVNPSDEQLMVAIINHPTFKIGARRAIEQGIIMELRDKKTGIHFKPDLKTGGSGTAIEFNGDTGSANQAMPYKRSAFFLHNGAFYTGVWMVISNKRTGINGDIQGVSAKVDGSEPSMLSVSPDVSGPCIALESRTKPIPGAENQSAIAFYNIDEIIGGQTPYSKGYGKKRGAILGDMTMVWGNDLSDTGLLANADIAILMPTSDGLELRGNLKIDGRVQATKFVFPTCTDAEMKAIKDPEPGQAVFNTTARKLFVYSEGQWWRQ